MNNIKEIIQQKQTNNCNAFRILYDCACCINVLVISDKKHECMQKVKICKKCGNFLCSRHITCDLSKCIMCKYSGKINRYDLMSNIMCKKCGILVKKCERKRGDCIFGYLCLECYEKYSHRETCFQI